VTQLAFLAEKAAKDDDHGFEMKPVDNSYGAASRPLLAALHTSVENMKKVSDNTSETRRTVIEPELNRLFVGIKNAYTNTLIALTKGQSIKGLLKEKLFEEGVPEWAHSRFTAKTFVLGRTEDLEKVLFPTDPTKGLALTTREWRDIDFVSKQGPLVEASNLVYTLINDDELVRAITGIAEPISLSSEENPQVAKLLAAKLVVMPPTRDAKRVIELGSKSKSGFKFPTPSMDTVTGSIVALSTALLRVYSANLQSVDIVSDYYATIAPGAVRREDVSPTNNFYVQWGKMGDPSPIWASAIRGGGRDMNLRSSVWRWIRTELRLSETAKAGKALAVALELTESGAVPNGADDDGLVLPDDPENLELVTLPPRARRPSEINRPDKSINVLRDLKDTEEPFWTKFQERVFPPAVGKKRQPVGLALTPLTPQGKQLLHRVKDISPMLLIGCSHGSDHFPTSDFSSRQLVSPTQSLMTYFPLSMEMRMTPSPTWTGQNRKRSFASI